VAPLPDELLTQILARTYEAFLLFDLEGRCLHAQGTLPPGNGAGGAGAVSEGDLSPRLREAFARLASGAAAEQVVEELLPEEGRWRESMLVRAGERIALLTRDVSARRRAEALAQRASELQALTAALSAALTQEDVVRVAVHNARVLMNATAAFFGLVDKERGSVELQGAVGLGEELEQAFRSVPLDAHTVLASIVREGKLFNLQLSAFRTAFPHIAPFWERAGLRSGIGVPLTITGERIGAFCLMFTEERPFSEEDVRFVTTLGELCGQAVQRTRLYTEARAAEARSSRDAKRLLRLADVSRALFEATHDHDSVLKTVADVASDAVGDSCLLSLLSEDGKALHFAAMATRNEELRPAMEELRAVNHARPIPADEGLNGQVLRTGKPLRVNGLTLPHASVAESSHRAAIARLPAHCALLVPLRAAERVFGVLSVARYEPGRHYSAEDEAFLQEIADRAALAVEKTRLYREAREAVKHRDDFLSIAGHELRTPMTAALLQVQGLSRLLARQPASLGSALPGFEDKLETLQRQMRRLRTLVDRLLDISRISAGQLSLEVEAFDLGALAREVIERASQDHPSRRDAVLLRSEGPVVGRWDRLRIDSVVTNLVSNALKYGEGSPVDVRVAQEGPYARLEVRDRGIGIPPEQQARIFSKFERAVSPRHYGGFGLGLWIAHQIVELHGGHIDVSSRLGEGATFVVRLPLR
jgi:signal transduction histidine kinase